MVRLHALYELREEWYGASSLVEGDRFTVRRDDSDSHVGDPYFP